MSTAGITASRATADGAPPLVEVEDVTFFYGESLILQNISCSVREGEFVSIIGASGCGKSTLLQILDGALQPAAGRVEVGGKPVAARNAERAMVFQSFALFPWRTVLDNVRLGVDYRRRDLSRKQRNEVARDYLNRVGLSKAEKSYPYQLSGGMQQRVGLARAFAVQPTLLLMDEPFGALDAQNAELLREDVRALVAQEQRSVVLVTHNLDEALQLSDRILLLRAAPGRVEDDINVRELRDDAENWRIDYSRHRDRLWDFLRQEVAAAQGRSLEDRS
ncbi:ABC transporter ATP-binding protein [Kribbella sp. VKM Ac-2568]|uniref:ABC transporter ATP-binding protein n=1 Tax=Kribbella sp. VKM Ac-2568 TaxID=2512219 RepID=UPI00105319DF|nr:ABC transporter ATP-binding protein [Kribbella sp. VKM Ac-2568]TCM42478.1 NitT/TauT family transport system ATP-binding protein [Kribbella sp. VKM Ac-2568]